MLIPKSYSMKVSIEGMDICEIVVTNRNGYKNVQQTSFSESSTNGKKIERLLFSLLDNSTLNTTLNDNL